MLNPKHHNKHISNEGLSVKRKMQYKDIDFLKCLKLLLDFKANPNPDPEMRGKLNKKRPTPIFQAIRSPESLQVLLDYTRDIKMLNTPNKHGKTPLIVAAES